MCIYSKEIVIVMKATVLYIKMVQFHELWVEWWVAICMARALLSRKRASQSREEQYRNSGLTNEEIYAEMDNSRVDNVVEVTFFAKAYH